MDVNFNKEISRNWLTLSQAADLVGVHPGTLRRWTDEGQIACNRTLGGHRRFSEEVVHSFLKSHTQGQMPHMIPESYVNGLIRHTRHELLTEQIKTQRWYEAFDEHDRNGHRDSGRVLLGLIFQYILRTSARQPILEQAAEIGRKYGCDAVTRGLSLVETVRAFYFFRETLIDTMRPGLVSKGKYDAEDARIYRSLREIMDHIFFAVLEGYETLELGNKGEELTA